MIGIIRQILELDDYYGQSDAIDIAKGKHKILTSIKDVRFGMKQLKRKAHARRSN